MQKEGAIESSDSDEMYEHFQFVAQPNQQPLRVDKFLMNFILNATRNKIQQAAKTGSIWVNDKAVKQNYKVKSGDEVKVVLSYPPRDKTIIPEDIPLDVVYEDDELLVVNKPAGMVVHPGHGNYTGTLVHALLYHYQNLPDRPKELDKPGLVHRIDKDTSGLLVVAKTDFAMAHLAKQFFEKTSKREYYALVWGDVEEEKGVIIGNIGRDPSNRLCYKVTEDEDAKYAETHYEVIERFGLCTLIKCQLRTGRTHQIRVHFKHLGHTLFNDERYGGDKILKGTTYSKYKQFVDNCFQILPRQALHAKMLGFEHPTTGEQMSFESDLPEEFDAVLEKWRRFTN